MMMMRWELMVLPWSFREGGADVLESVEFFEYPANGPRKPGAQQNEHNRAYIQVPSYSHAWLTLEQSVICSKDRVWELLIRLERKNGTISCSGKMIVRHTYSMG